jgi:nitroimidazol reductase NimA-like FMN-containing flavoprotein (pyridoxamine 5'-phosphate oxidase superfamily)
MKNRTIDHISGIVSIINKCDVCYMGMVDQEYKPYVLPFNFGFDGEKTLFLHSAQTGKKIDILANNPNVCLAFSTDHELRYQSEEVACSWGMKYRSVLAYGKVEFIEEYDKKVEVLNFIMQKYAGKDYTYNEPAVKGVKTFKVVVERFEGRAYGY